MPVHFAIQEVNPTSPPAGQIGKPSNTTTLIIFFDMVENRCNVAYNLPYTFARGHSPLSEKKYSGQAGKEN